MSGIPVVYDYPAAAISCCFNGRRIRGISRVICDDGPGWVILANGVRVRISEIVMCGTHPFRPDASGFGCTACGFNERAEIHAA